MSDTSTAEPVIDIVGLAKNFGHAHALSGLDLRVERGKCMVSSARTAPARMTVELSYHQS